MIIKTREKSDSIVALHSILRRIPSKLISHELILNQLSPLEAGFSGEMKVDWYLKELNLSSNFFILQDLIIPRLHSTLQLDTVLVTPKFICILEIKNMTGEFYFDSEEYQFYRIKKEGVKEPQRSPEIQLRRAVRTLRPILQQAQIELPIVGIIVFASRSGLIVEKPKHFSAVLLDRLNEHIEAIDKSMDNRLTYDEMNQLAQRLLSLHQHEKFNCVFQRHGMKKSWVTPGVICPICKNSTMQRLNARWLCHSCKSNSNDAHLITLQEYRVLFDKDISNREASWFLSIPSSDTTRRLLIKAGFPYTGSFKDRIYQVPKEASLVNQILLEDSYRTFKRAPTQISPLE
ncbi:NERD domain-containing protein [Sporosarcina sp. ANT_H38]|uniref:nuclease-related domain-containing protein n=1 Tax=Sporosarcina sp. ANT_H38 TaxID=2597358 RepID=UPI0011F37C5B|nr:nuclease-related domain-containing protein [Sporosarcina sp. ANT_H38]KAA0965464.1 NERD domain-containing protein [Sporosarcina sp. ANT_H38]